jgi:hypothetical protein
MNYKGKFDKVHLLIGTCWTYRQGKSSKDVQKVLFQVLYLFERVRIRIHIKQSDPDPYQIEKQDPDQYQSEKQDPDQYQKGLDPQHWAQVSITDIIAFQSSS